MQHEIGDLPALLRKFSVRSARFLGGHPVAGKEISGINRATPDLFCGARYALIAAAEDDDPRVIEFTALVQQLGAEPLFCDAETHDWAAGVVSHLPQLVALALSRVVLDETDETGLPASLSGSGLRDTVRLAGSPYASVARYLPDQFGQYCAGARSHVAGAGLFAREPQYARARR